MRSARYFPKTGHLFYFWKGRVALYALLKALGLRPGDEVILPGFTCVVVPNAVLYAGARPIYADIEPDTYTVSAATIEPLLTKRTKVILAQNTFGLSADLEPIIELAHQHRVFVIEDCAHGLGGFYRGQRNGTVAQAAFFSTQWSKPISTGLGGVAFTHDDVLARRIKAVARTMPRPTLGQQIMLAAQRLARPLANHPTLHYPLVSAYRFVTRKLDLSVGSNCNHELETVEMPPAYARRMGLWQRQGWQRGLAQIDQKIKRSQETAAFYDEFLNPSCIDPPQRPYYAEHGMLRYTVRVSERDKLLQKARCLRIPVGDWFGSPLYPVERHLSRWGYTRGQCPVAERACQEVINLPTAQPLTTDQLTRLFKES